MRAMEGKFLRRIVFILSLLIAAGMACSLGKSRPNVSFDPKFIDIGASDFHLQPDSPMIDAGIDVGIPFCRAAPDLGASEVCP